MKDHSMHNITATQCFVARAYLRWSQENLAKAADVSISTVRSFENGYAPRRNTMKQLRKTFERNGIEFTEGEGVRRRPEDVQVYRGTDGCDQFFEDVLQEVKDKSGDMCALWQSNDMLTQPSGMTHLNNLERLERVYETAKVKCLVSSRVTPSFMPPSFQIRQAFRPIDNPASFFVYGDKYAVLHLNGRSNFIFTVWDIPALSNDYKLHFLSLWDDAPLLAIPAQHQNKLLMTA